MGSTRPQNLLILTAVMLEARAVADALGVACCKPRQPSRGQRGGVQVTLAVTGIGATTLPDGPADCVLMAGLAGALDPSLNIGDMIVDDWPNGWRLPIGARTGKIHTAARIASTPERKAELFSQTSALAVDMENQSVREWARTHGVAFGAIRAISDRANQSLDPAVLRFVDPWGRAKPFALARLLLTNPKLIPHLMRLGRDSKIAARRLGQCVTSVVECLS